MKTSRWLAAALVLVLVIGGFLVPLAGAQMAPAPPAPPPLPAPAQGPAEPGQGAKVGAGFLNVVYVPGKVILCGAGAVVSAGLMVLTFGSAYHAATQVFNEGCGGPWVLTPYDVTGRRPPEG